MNKDEYKEYVNGTSQNKNIIKKSLVSFISGGTLAAIYEILVEIFIKLFDVEVNFAIGYTTLIYIAVAIFLTGIGKFDTFIKKYRFGLIIPITGFAHSIMSSLMEYKYEGLISGMGSNMFKLAGSVILYGSLSAFLFTFLKVIINA